MTAALGTLPAAAQPARAHAAFLDSHEAVADGAAGPRTVSSPLRRGRFYRVTVEGTFPFYSAGSWASSCGRTEARARFASPGQPLGPVGFDAERILALPASEAGCAGPALPRPWRNFQLDTGTGFRHPRAEAARPGTHTHRYRVQGRGRALRARLVDSYAGDNYGRLRITVRPLGGAPR